MEMVNKAFRDEPERQPWEIVKQEFTCAHEEAEVRRVTCSDGRIQFARQCLACGSNLGNVKKLSIPGLQRIQTVEFDRDLQQAWFEAQRERHIELSDERKQEESRVWWVAYNAYLASPLWQARRLLVFKRAHGTCEGCLVNPAVHVHHLTYERVTREMAFDLVAVCLRCHRALHPGKWDEQDG